MKTLRRKLFLSILAVAFAVVSLATSTFAWFAMNDEVKVDGMKTKINSDYAYLLVKEGNIDSAATIQADKTREITVTTPSKLLFPVAHETLADKAAADLNTNWYYQYSNNVDYSLGNGDNALSAKKQVASADYGKYVFTQDFSFTLAKGSVEMENLKVKSITINTGALTTGEGNEKTNIVNVFLAGDNGVHEYTETSTTESGVLVSSLTDAGVGHVRLYIYWNGAHADVKTANQADLAALEASISVTFTAKVKTA